MTEDEAKQDIELYNIEYRPLNEKQIAEGHPDCKTCGNKRYLAKACRSEEFDYWYVLTYPCKCNNTIQSISNIADSGLAGLINDFRFSNFNAGHDWQKNMKDTAIEFGKSIASGGTEWLLVLGQSGAGKTHICTAVCGAFLKKGCCSVKYFRWSVEGKRIKAIANSTDYAAEISKIMSHNIIYIDDLFKRKKGAEVTDADIKLAFELIDTAFAERKILIVSGEDSFVQLHEIDEAIAGRLKQNAGRYVILLFGQEKNQRMQRKE